MSPPPNVLFSLLDPQNVPVRATMSTGSRLSFDFSISLIGPASVGRYVGDFVRNQGGRRFFYFASGTLAGQTDSCWTRRGKVMLDTLDPDLVERAVADGFALEAFVPGAAPDGGPACATVKLMTPWLPLSK